MKKWIVFLSVTCAICVVLLGFVVQYLISDTNTYKYLTELSLSNNSSKYYLTNIIKFSIMLFLLLSLLAFNVYMLINVALGKIATIDLKANMEKFKENRTQQKATRQQRKLEKAQAKVEKLKEDIEKDA